ncbi:MAG: acyltransferase family protein [Gemmatimonadales bacterium]
MLHVVDWQRLSMDRIGWRRGPSPQSRVDGRVDSLESARVQTMRGLACLLLVAFHAIGSTAASGLHVADDSAYRLFTNLFVHMRMPAFTFLSGLVYAWRPLRAGDERWFMGKKLRRLGVPLIVASTVLYVLHTVMHHPVPPLSDLWTIYVFPYWHLWFVQALLLVFTVLIALEWLGALATFPRFLAVFAAAVALYAAAPFEARNILGVHNATYLFPFFLCGLGAHRFRGQLRSRRAVLATLLCLAVAQGLHTYLVLTSSPAPIDPLAHRSALHLLIGMSASLCALEMLPRVSVLERIGASSYPIYLYHPLFVAAVLVLAVAHPAAPASLLFLAAGAAGVAGPMLMERVARHLPAGPFLLAGQRPATVIRLDEARAGGIRIPAGGGVTGLRW